MFAEGEQGVGKFPQKYWCCEILIGITNLLFIVFSNIFINVKNNTCLSIYVKFNYISFFLYAFFNLILNN